MVQARATVHRLGGLEHSNSYVRFYLALAGALGWEMVPAIFPEMMLLPRWFYLNIYEMSSWTRGIVIPMAILSALRPDWRLAEHARVDELFKDASNKKAAFDWSEQLISWKNVFLALDRALKVYERLPWKPLRQRAIREAKQWMLQHIERTDGLAAIYPAMMNSIFALMALGHRPDDPLTWREIKEFSRFEIEDADTIRLQPCVSPVWDTCIAMVALEEAGVAPDHPALVQAADWILSKQILGPGDWQVKNKDAEPGGWAFEFRNDYYPDVDDTAFVLMALQRVKFPDEKRMEGALRRGIQWMLSMSMRVVAANSAPCFRCYHCRRGQENLCDDLLFNNGAYAEYMRIPGRIVTENMLEVPHSVDDQSAALVEPLACVLRGIHEMELRTGDTAVVIGCGPIGLKFVRMLSRRGIRVIALARRDAPLNVARKLGAFATINVSTTPDPVATARALTEDQRGPDAVVEAAGNPSAWQLALGMLRLNRQPMQANICSW